nr:helix-turn-helix transcriptional regulator [Megamonas funiformis]
MKKICANKNITLNKLCTMAGITQSTASNIIHGNSKNPGIVTIKKLCDAVDITIQEFFDDELFYNLEQEIE